VCGGLLNPFRGHPRLEALIVRIGGIEPASIATPGRR
jgi:hypothetical protein